MATVAFTGVTAGWCAASVIGRRVAFHCSDGVLAADALHLPTRLRYMALWHGAGLILLLCVMSFFAGPVAASTAVPGYLLGAVAGTGFAAMAGLNRIGMPGFGPHRAGRSLASLAKRRSAGIAAALALTLLAFSTCFLQKDARWAICAAAAFVIGLALTRVDAKCARFAAICGQRPMRSICDASKAVFWFLVLGAAGVYPVLGLPGAGIVAGISTVLLFVLALRVSLYRIHGRRRADIVMAMFASVVLVTGATAALAVPVVCLLIGWRCYRQADSMTWEMT